MDTEGGLYLAAEDLAKLWYLFLRDGRDGQQVVSPERVRASVTPAADPRDPARPGLRYGLKWWLDPNPMDGTRFIWVGSGFGGQHPIAVPEEDLIVVINQWNVFPGQPRMSPAVAMERVLRAVTDRRP